MSGDLQSFKSKVVSGFVWGAAVRFVVQIASWASTLWVARWLSPDDYGLVAVSGIFTGLGLLVAGLGLGSAIVNRKIVKRKHTDALFFLCLSLGLLVCLGITLLAPLVAGHFRIQELRIALPVAALIIIVSAAGVVPTALAMRALLLRETALVHLLAGSIVIVMTITMAYLGYAYWALLIPVLCSEIVIVCCFFALVRYKPSFPRAVFCTVPYVRYGFKISSAGVVGHANGQWPIFIIGSFLGQTAVGYYQLAMVLASMPKNKVGEIFSSVTFPAVSRIRSDVARVGSFFAKTHAFLNIVSIPMFVGLALVADLAVPLLIGEKWLPIVPLIQIISLGMLFAVGSQLIMRVIEGMGLPRITLRLQLLLFLAIPVLLMLGVPFELTGVAVVWTLVFPLTYAMLLSRIRAVTNVKIADLFARLRPCGVAVAGMAAATVGMGILVRGLTDSSLLVLIAEVSAGAFVYSASLLAMDRSIVADIRQLFKKV